MRIRLAMRTLLRHRARTALAVLGVAVAAAMLLDMVMLSSGLRESFAQLLTSRGFQFRLAPRGTLPFDTEATIARGTSIAVRLAAHPDIEAVSPVLGSSLHMMSDGGAVTTFGLGVHPALQGDYTLERGKDIIGSEDIVANEDFLRLTGRAVGDTILLAAGYNPLLRAATGERRLVVRGKARFLYLSAAQPAVALELRTLQEMTGAAREDRVSLMMVQTRSGAEIDTLGAWIERVAPTVNAISTREALANVDQRLSYFRQIAFILGAVSLVVGFLLVTTLVTVSVNERAGEIAVLRAIGISRLHIVQQIVIEGIVISVLGATLGLALGLATARYLNTILSSFPGLPEAIDFFLFQPASVWRALGLLVGAGILAGIFPAWRAGSLAIAQTLREEAVA
ncbi:MAG TPA: FtsX-like permease family protein [Gemmatimonadaceae bacterium]|nr:FtsX-like permease family protein [Gemmatimonadaceae bacterium]